MNLHWYVLRSKPNKELTRWREICARGFDCFFPHLKVRPVNLRSRKIRPYFPGYLFLQTAQALNTRQSVLLISTDCLFLYKSLRCVPV